MFLEQNNQSKPEKPIDKAYNLSEIIKRLRIQRLGSENQNQKQTTPADFLITVKDPSSATFSEIWPKLRQQIPGKYWWLNDGFKNREKPTKLELKEGNELYDFTGEITPERLEIINRINTFFGKILASYNTPLPKYLIFDKEQKENFNSGFPMNGEVKSNWDAIQFFPEAFTEGKYRAKERSKFPDDLEHFLGVVIHEYSHLLESEFTEVWKENFGWIRLEKPQKLAGDSYKYDECVRPEECMGDYALFHSMEDFCESTVAYLLAPETLKQVSRSKFNFLNNILQDYSLDLAISDIPKPEKANCAFPVLPDVITVKTRKSLSWK